MQSKKKKSLARTRRRFRIRKRLAGTPERPRLVVYRSARNVEVQIIDDQAGHSLVGMSTLSKGFERSGTRAEQGHALGKLVASKAQEKGIQAVVFDRAGLLYHGVIRAVAEGAREGGLRL
ncbi:MAG: 50S ribosomal protein L18 [Candidatus Latescibacterota bacterium]|nr:50S ribosomal protein L18 [Candidatus Latescibacterota bacterium]